MRFTGFLLVCVIVSMVVSYSETLVSANGPPFSIIRQGATSEFPEGVKFFLDASSLQPITDIRVYFEKMGQSSRRSYRSLEFRQDKLVSANFSMKSGSGGQYIPPGTRIEYFFEITNAVGEEYVTERAIFIYLDPKFEWKTLTDGLITVFFNESSMQDVAQSMLEIAGTTLQNMRPVLGINPEEPLHIVTYKDYKTMSKALPFRSKATSQHLITQGMAFREERVLLVHGQSNTYRGTTSHEFTHLLLADAASRAIQRVPAWLNEGLAEYGNQNSSGEYDRYLQYGIENGKLRPLWHLGTFSGSPGEVILSYGQGKSVVEYLISTYGDDKMAGLIQNLKRTFDIDKALELTYGFNLYGLDTDWRKSLGVEPLTSPKKQIPEQLQQEVTESTIVTPIVILTPIPTMVPYLSNNGVPAIDKASTDGNYRDHKDALMDDANESQSSGSPGCSVIYNSSAVQADVSILTLLGGLLLMSGFVVWRRRGY